MGAQFCCQVVLSQLTELKWHVTNDCRAERKIMCHDHTDQLMATQKCMHILCREMGIWSKKYISVSVLGAS